MGAGLAGIALYLALDKSKFTVDIFERRKRTENLGFAVIFMPNGVRALRKLGFPRSDINKLGKPVRKIVSHLPNKILISDLGYLYHKYDKYLIVQREKLYKLILNKVPKGVVRFNTEISKLEFGRKTTHVRFRGERSFSEYDLVVGADGVNSTVRSLLFPNAKPIPQKHLIMWAWLPRGSKKLSSSAVALDKGKSGIGYFDTDSSERVCAFYYAEKTKFQKNLSSHEYVSFWSEDLKDLDYSPVHAKHERPMHGRTHVHEDRIVSLPRWSKGSVVLIGDAAHARSVFTGAGTALALEDGYLLGHYLNTESTVQNAIRNFEMLQRPRVRKLVPVLGEKFTTQIEEFLASDPIFS